MAAEPSPRALFPQSLVGFTVQPGGAIAPVPTRFGVGSHEMVLWVIGNASGGAVTVTLQDFLRDSDRADPVNPLAWLVSNSVQIGDGQVALIAGIKNANYQHKHLVDRVKYTILVEGNGFALAHDPDGDIKP